ncbi:hypothetical protein EDD75_0319 [Thermodesulfitimonas autotrophica]|uniref:VWFA domain-containing protein n=1 Tax=Thermodesulfitimonas autotrophica TaxID=1894989 RepID=A0A3N5AX85_9THEO|nr:hypothetical protein [Thermodesulfitimonas autotrophica]RPF49503.1 hypothetical protein EDD75_0319 [Thermodesulfitimonas autotrophica]
MSALLKELWRERLQSLARAFTEKNDLVVRFGSVSRTNLSEIEIKDCLEKGEIVSGVPAPPGKCAAALRTLCAHESAHILFTARGVMEVARSRGGLLLQHIVNVLEDARVERAMANAVPGTLRWFRDLNNYVVWNRKDWGEGATAFIGGLCAYAMAGKVPDALDREIKGLIDKCKPIVDEARLAGSTWEVLERAEKIHALVKDAFPPPNLPPVPETGTDSPREAPQGPLDPRRISVKRKKQQENDSSLKEPREDKAGDQTDGEGEREDTNNSGESAEKNRLPKEASDGSRDDSREGSENEPETSEEDGNGSFGEDHSEESGEAESKPKEQSNPGPGGEENSEEADGEGGGSGETGTGADANEESSEDGETGDGDDGETGDGESSASDGRATEDDAPNDQDSDEEGDGPGRDTGDQNDGGQDNPGDFKEGEAKEDPTVPETFDEPEPFDEEEDHDLSALAEEVERELAALAAAAERREKEAARSATPKPDWDEVREEVSQDLHRDCRFEWHELPPAPQDYQELVRGQQGTIRRLVEEIRKALEFKATVARRNLKKGRLDAGSLWKLRVPDPRVFSRRETPGDVPAVAVYLLVDCSDSMSGYQKTSQGTSEKVKIVLAKEAAAVLHEACVTLNVPHAVVGFNSCHPNTRLYRAVRWDERDGSKIPSLWPNNANRDGFAIRVVSRELELRPEPRKVLIVLSDGLPNDFERRYNINASSVPVADAARAVRELERRGVGVVGLYFGHEHHIQKARTIYNRFVFVQDVGHLPVILGRVLKQVITGGA